MESVIDWSKLKEPFPEEDLEWRIQRSGKGDKGIWAMCLVYITNRAIMDRLDEVVGADRWKNKFKTGPEGGVLCGISIKVSEEWITKWDGAENTDVEAIKGGLSGAMKRAAVQWGIGRYLYDFDDMFAVVGDSGRYRATLKDKTAFKWSPPPLNKVVANKKEALLTFSELETKIKGCKTVKNLGNIWTQYQLDILALSEEDRNRITVVKDRCKDELKQESK